MDDVNETLKDLPNQALDPNFLQIVLNAFLALAGIIAVGVIVYAGIKYISAQGEPDKIKNASQVISYGVIGLIITVVAAAIVNFVLGIAK